MGALRGWASVCQRQTSPPTSAGRGEPKTPQPGFAGAEALARGNRLSGSPTKGSNGIHTNHINLRSYFFFSCHFPTVDNCDAVP